MSASRFSARRRARNRRRLKGPRGNSSGALTKTCSILGSVSRACLPQADVLTGTVRHPATSRPISAMQSLITDRARDASDSSRLRKTQPAAKRSDIPNPCSSPTARRKSRGNLISRPQPSPVLPSGATAPRCVSRASAAIAVWTSQWLGISSRFAIRPNPQLSRWKAALRRVLAFCCVIRAAGSAGVPWCFINSLGWRRSPRTNKYRAGKRRRRSRQPKIGSFGCKIRLLGRGFGVNQPPLTMVARVTIAMRAGFSRLERRRPEAYRP